MATISRARRADELRSGGKIVRNRRIAALRTPYDRPTLRAPVPASPNWLSAATRMIATGAGKFISSVFGPESSSSSSSSGSDSSSDDEVNDDNDYDGTSPGADRLKKTGMQSQMIQSFRKEPQPAGGENETKRVIEELLMQETFSREECDRLTGIIKSRVVDCLTIQDGSLSGIPNRTVGSDAQITDLSSTAVVMEARKWLEEKKLGSSSKSEFDHGICSLNSVMIQQVSEGETHSPVDMAKSYMQARPPWTSPSLNSVEFKTTSPIRMQPFKAEAPYSIGSNSPSSAKLKRDSLTAGSWNILEEIRRVRAKATEDMLGTLPSKKTDLSTFALEHKSSPNSLLADKTEAGLRDGSEDVLRSEQEHKSADDTKITLQSEDDVFNDANEPHQHPSSTMEGAIQEVPDPRSNERDSLTSKEATAIRDVSTANGFPSPVSSLSPRLDSQPNPETSNEEHQDPISSSAPVEEACELLRASLEVPINNETIGSIASGSQDSYSELTQKPVRAKSKRGLAGKTSDVVEKAQEKKQAKYGRRGRGRGK